MRRMARYFAISSASPGQKRGSGNSHIVEIGRLLEIRLIEGGNLLELRARHIESAVHLDAGEARLRSQTSPPVARGILEGGAFERGVAGEGGASNKASPEKVALRTRRRRRRWRCEPGVAGEGGAFEPEVVRPVRRWRCRRNQKALSRRRWRFRTGRRRRRWRFRTRRRRRRWRFRTRRRRRRWRFRTGRRRRRWRFEPARRRRRWRFRTGRRRRRWRFRTRRCREKRSPKNQPGLPQAVLI